MYGEKVIAKLTGALAVTAVLAACTAPPIRSSFSGAPGRLASGDVALTAAAAIGLMDHVDPVGVGELDGAYAFSDSVAVEGGATGGVGDGWGYTGGWAGVRMTLPTQRKDRLGVVWDTEVGVGAGAIFEPDTYYAGGYGGFGLAQRWTRFALFGRLRVQAASGGDTATCLWSSLAIGGELGLSERIHLFATFGESLYLAEEDDYGFVPTLEIGLTARL